MLNIFARIHSKKRVEKKEEWRRQWRWFWREVWLPRMARKWPSRVCRMVIWISWADLPRNCSEAVCSSSLAVMILHWATPVTVKGTPWAVSTVSHMGFSVITWGYSRPGTSLFSHLIPPQIQRETGGGRSQSKWCHWNTISNHCQAPISISSTVGMKLRDVNAAKRATESEFSPDRGTPRNGRLHGGHCLRARSHTASDRRPVPLLKLRPSCVIFFPYHAREIAIGKICSLSCQHFVTVSRFSFISESEPFPRKKPWRLGGFDFGNGLERRHEYDWKVQAWGSTKN